MTIRADAASWDTVGVIVLYHNIFHIKLMNQLIFIATVLQFTVLELLLMSPKKIEQVEKKGDETPEEKPEEKPEETVPENVNATVASGSNQAPSTRNYSLSVRQMPVDEETIVEISKYLSTLSLEEIEKQEVVINKQLKEMMVSMKFLKEKKSELEAPEKKKKQKEKKEQRKKVKAEKTQQERDELRTITVVFNGVPYMFYLRGKDRLGTLRQRLVDAIGSKKSQKFIFRFGETVGMGDIIEADPTKTLRMLNIHNGAMLNASIPPVDNNAAPDADTDADARAIPLGVQSEGETHIETDGDDASDDEDDDEEQDDSEQ